MCKCRHVTQHVGNVRVLTFEVHIAGSRANPLVIHKGLETFIRTWRSMAQWTLLVAKDAEKEAVVCVLVAERHEPTARVDNAFLTWSRTLSGLFTGINPQRRQWVAAPNGRARVYADVKAGREKTYNEVCENVREMARCVAGSNGHLSVSSDWSPLLPPDELCLLPPNAPNGAGPPSPDGAAPQ